MAIAGHQLAVALIHPVQIAFVVTDHHQVVLHRGTGEAAAIELVLLPQEGAAALVDAANQALIIADEQRAQIGTEALVAGNVLGPVGAAVFPVQHRHLALERSGEHTAVLHDQAGVDVHQTVQFGAAGGLGHPALPDRRTGLFVQAHHLAAGKRRVDTPGGDHRLCAAQQNQVGNGGLVLPARLTGFTIERLDTAVDGLVQRQGTGAGGGGEDLAAQLAAPQFAAVLGGQRHRLAFPGAVVDLAVAGEEAAGDAILGLFTPLPVAVFAVERVDLTVHVGGEHLLAGHRRAQFYRGLVHAVAGIGFPQPFDLVGTVEVRQIIGLDGVGVAAASGQHQRARHQGHQAARGEGAAQTAGGLGGFKRLHKSHD